MATLHQKRPHLCKVPEILDDLEDRSIVLRVTDWASRSPYDPYDGFTATADTFLDISRTRFRRQFTGRGYMSPWKRSESTLDSMVNHILGGWGGYTHSRTGQSPWISSTADFDWAIYEVARRLAKIRQGTAQLSVINTKNTRIRVVGARPQWRIPEDSNERELAVRFATASSEVLWYGRIFEEDVRMVTNWTYATPGFKLPPEFRQPPRLRESGASWIDNLSFDPRNDSFYEAREKIERRRDQVDASRQPRRDY